MNELRSFEVDERDSTWESHDPRFRVYFFSGGTEGPGWATEVHDVTGADALQAIDWAQRTAGPDRLYAVALVDDHVRSPGRGLVWLVGMDANDAGDLRAGEVRRRMITRRSQPVIVPPSDQAAP